MFGIDWSEFLVVAIVAVIAIGPKDIPHALYKAGKFIRKIKKLSGEFQKSLDEVMTEGELEDIAREANKPGAENIQFEVERQLRLEQEDKKNNAA